MPLLRLKRGLVVGLVHLMKSQEPSRSDLNALLFPAEIPNLEWLMEDGEKAALLQVLRASRREAALEIGTCKGEALATYANTPEPPTRSTSTLRSRASSSPACRM